MSKKKVLFLSEEIPFKRDSGQRVKMYNVLRCLAELYELTCVFLYWKEEDIKFKKAGMDIRFENYFIKLPNNKTIRNITTLIRRIYLNRNIKEKLDIIVKEVKPDIVWLEFYFIGQYIPFFKKRNIPVIYVSHNAQAYLDYIGWKLEKSIAKKIIRTPYIILNYLHEHLFFPKADKFLCISENDKKYHSSFISNRKIDILPNFYIEKDLEKVQKFEPPHRYICMVGSLYAFQNYLATLFLLKEIWTKIKLRKRNRDLYLYLVGKLPPKDTRKYEDLKSLTEKMPDVILTGEVENAIPYVKGALVTLVPVLHGSGTRTKIVESVACKTSVVSTTCGAEGLPFSDGRSIMIADIPELFAEKVDRLISDERLRKDICKEAFSIFEKYLGYNVNKERIEQVVESIFIE